MKERIEEAAGRLTGTITSISRSLHADPELSLDEHRAAGRLCAALEEAGFAVTCGQAGMPTAFVARAGDPAAGPTVAFLAEYDALPGIGHGCGHNLIAAAGAGAGLVLARAARDGVPLPGEILVVGTPAEETIGGKVPMVREGVFAGVAAALMIHPSWEWRVETDSLACASIEVVYLGREAHAAAWPERGINALDALVQLYVAVDMLRKRLGREVRTPGVILEGGLRPNIIPARAVGAFSLRAPTTRRLAEVRAEVERAARGIAEATGCRVELRQTDNTYDDMLTNTAIANRFREHLAASGVTTNDGAREHKGSLDMGNVSRAVPSVHAFIRVADQDVPLHSAGFAGATISPGAEEALMIAVRAMALTGFDLLSDERLLRAARDEFEAAVAAGGAR